MHIIVFQFIIETIIIENNLQILKQQFFFVTAKNLLLAMTVDMMDMNI